MAFAPSVALKYLRHAHESSRLAHAYLFAGESGSGKRQLAAELAHLVNGVPSGEVFTGKAPDVFLAAPESRSRRIGIDQLRELEHALQMRSTDGRQKVAIVSDVERMTQQAANAFLKTLEEPPNNSLLVLLSAIPEALPETILSRCIQIPLASPNETKRTPEQLELVEVLNSADINSQGNVHEAYRLVQAFQQLLGRIKQTIQDESAASLKREETRYRNTTEGDWLESREDYYKALTESRYIHERAQLLEILFLWWSDVLRASTGVSTRELPDARTQTEAVAARLTTPEILQRLRTLEELRDHLGRTIQEALAIEVAFLKLFAISP